MSVRLVSPKTSLPGLQVATPLLCPHTAFPQFVHMEKERKSSLPLLIRPPILSDQGSTPLTSFNLN